MWVAWSSCVIKKEGKRGAGFYWRAVCVTVKAGRKKSNTCTAARTGVYPFLPSVHIHLGTLQDALPATDKAPKGRCLVKHGRL